jgi:hypothetical protein
MSGAELGLAIAGIVSAVITGVSKIHDYIVAKKNRKDIKAIKAHTEPKIILVSSDGSVIPSKPNTPKEIEQTNSVETNAERYVVKNLYLDTETGNYLEYLPLETPRPKHPY